MTKGSPGSLTGIHTLFDRLVYSMIYDVSSSDELLELRQILDESTVQLAMSKITPEEVEKLQHSIDKMKDACKNQDVDRKSVV